MSGSFWTPQAVNAVRRTLCVTEDEARAVLAAAEPSFRDMLAREVEVEFANTEFAGPGWVRYVAAALRAGVPAPEPTTTECGACYGHGVTRIDSVDGRRRFGFCSACDGTGVVPAPEPTKGNT